MSPHPPPLDRPIRRVLVVDDSEGIRSYLADLLKMRGYEVDTVEDGRRALALLEAGAAPDVILLDVMMPKRSGFEVCRQLKDDPATRHIMVLMVTALNELGDIERAVAAGTDDFLSKPVNKVELVKRVENMLRLKDVADENERLRQYIRQMEESAEPASRGDA